MAKNLISRTILAWPRFRTQKCFRGFCLYQMLGIVASYHCKQSQGKHMIQTQENGEKPYFGSDLGPLRPHLGCQNIFSEIWLHQSLDTMVSYHHVKYQKKTNDPILKKFSDGRTDRQTNRRTRVVSQDAEAYKNAKFKALKIPQQYQK